jgi:hypothetical protein
MADIVLLISETYLKDATVINDNVEVKVLRSNIRLAQDLYIHPMLGTALYDQICDQVQNSTLTVANETLLDDYIKPSLKYFVLYESGRDVTYKFMNKGLLSKNSENSNAVDPSTLKQIREEYKDKGEWYRQRMIDFILENETDYPEFTSNTRIDQLRPKKNGFTSPIYLKKKRADDDCCDDNNIIIHL